MNVSSWKTVPVLLSDLFILSYQYLSTHENWDSKELLSYLERHASISDYFKPEYSLCVIGIMTRDGNQ